MKKRKKYIKIVNILVYFSNKNKNKLIWGKCLVSLLKFLIFFILVVKVF